MNTFSKNPNLKKTTTFFGAGGGGEGGGRVGEGVRGEMEVSEFL